MDQTSMNPVQGSNYDSAGNEQYDGLNRYLYDGEGRICAITNSTGSLIGYVYDAEGNRVGKGSLTSFSCDRTTNGFSATAGIIVGFGGEQLTEITGSGFWDHSNLFLNGQLFATYKSSHLYFGLSDWLGTRRAEASSSCATTTYSNLPFGTALVTTGGCPYSTEQHFTGKERDSDSGNDYFGARYYTSTMGRFLSPDWSAKVEPVPYSKLDDPQSLNLYSYVGNNPMNRIDPDGHCSKSGDTTQNTECAEENAAQNLNAAERASQVEAFVFGEGSYLTGPRPGDPAGSPDHLEKVDELKYPNSEAWELYRVEDENNRPTGVGGTLTEHVKVTEQRGAIIDPITSHDVPINKNSLIKDEIGPSTRNHQEAPGTYYSFKTLQTFTVSYRNHTYTLTTKIQQFGQVQDGKVTQAGSTILVP